MDELKELVREYRFWKNNLRTNIGESAPSKYGGRPMLLEPVLSNTIRGTGKTKQQARMLDLVREMLPDLHEPVMLTLNRNVTCLRHKDKRNIGHSYIAFLDGEVPFTGGQLIVEEPEGDRVIAQKDMWHKFSGNEHFHYNLPHTGDKLSIVAYQGQHKPTNLGPSAPRPSRPSPSQPPQAQPGPGPGP